MMNNALNDNIKSILRGNLSVEETQKLLTDIDEEAFKKALSQDDVKALFERYLENNQDGLETFQAEPIAEMERLWSRIEEDVDRVAAEPFTQTFYRSIKRFFSQKRYQAAMAAIVLVICLFPLTTRFVHLPTTEHQGIKGVEEKSVASFQYAILGSDNKLLRPDRVLTEKDTIAFRVDVKSTGFCSLYALYPNTVDKIIADKLLRNGVHDLSIAYSLSGNKGPNTLIMLFSKAPIAIDEKDKQRLIVESAVNKVTSMTIGSNDIYLEYENFLVNGTNGNK